MRNKVLTLLILVFLLYRADGQVGKVGINTASPLAILHVEDSCVLFRGTYNAMSPGSIPVGGAGTRLLWYPGKAAFRAGRVTGSEWSKSNIGDYSFAAGYNARATGMYAMAVGNAPKATGDASVAFGQTYAKPYAAFVIGRNNDTTSISSTSWNAMDPVFIIGNGPGPGDLRNALTVLKSGNVGIGELTPNASLHIGKGTGGGLYHSAAAMIIEDDANAYLQFSTPDAFLSGIVSGNAMTEFRSGLIFRTDDGIDLRAGGNTTRLRIESGGDIDMMSGELQRTVTGEANLVPICYGVVTDDVVTAGTGNFTVEIVETGIYKIDINGVDYNSDDYTTLVTCKFQYPCATFYVDNGIGKLIIRTYDIQTNELLSLDFSFIVYKN